MISQMIHIEYAVFVAYHAADASFFIKPIDFHTVYWLFELNSQLTAEDVLIFERLITHSQTDIIRQFLEFRFSPDFSGIRPWLTDSSLTVEQLIVLEDSYRAIRHQCLNSVISIK